MDTKETTAPEIVAPGASRQRRADAVRNAGRVLAAATKVFEAEGLDAPLETIARRAGVGIATLYRHFPTRQALIEAVFQERVDASLARANELLASPEPFDALSVWLGEQLEQAAACHGLGAEAMTRIGSDAPTPCAAMREAGAALLARADASGWVRPGVDVDELLRFVSAIVTTTRDLSDGGEQARRMLAVVLDGLRAPDAPSHTP